MNVHLLSIVAGSEACNARCPFCISKMTPDNGVTDKEPEVNWRNFNIAAKLAKQGGAQTAMITGKGEPLLFPNQLNQYMDALKSHDFPLIELQTNGILLAEQKERYVGYLKRWYDAGMTTVALSIVHYAPEPNRQIYLPYRKQYIDLPNLIRDLHDTGLSVRLACIMNKGFIDNASELEKLISFAKENKVEQLSVRPVNAPSSSENHIVQQWVKEHLLDKGQKEDIFNYLEKNGTRVNEYDYGAIIYDVHGQNVCATSSLTRNTAQNTSRQIIFFPDGHIRYDWEYEGAIII